MSRLCLIAGCPVGTVVATVVTGFMSDSLGWHSSFYLFG